MIVGAAVLALALTPVAGSADWKTRAARKTVGNVAREGVESATKDTAMDATLGVAGVPDGPKLDHNRPGDARGRVGEARNDRDRPAIDSAAREGLEAAMSVADVGSSIEHTMELADAAKRANKVRKVVR